MIIRKKTRELERAIEARAALFEQKSDLDGFLGEVVGLVADFAKASMCAIYLYEPQSRELVLRSFFGSEAARPTIDHLSIADGRVGAAMTEGNPAYFKISHTGSGDEFKSRLVLPIRRGPVWLGVMILAQPQRPARDVRLGLQSVISLLGAILEDGSLLLEAREVVPEEESGLLISGRTAAEGVTAGLAFPFEAGFEEAAEDEVPARSTEEWLAEFDTALEESSRQLHALHEDQSQLDDIVALIFSAHLLMLNDPEFTGAMRKRIEEGESAPGAIRSIVGQYARVFAAMEDVRIAEKAQDVRDLGYRLLRNLSGKDEKPANYRGQVVVAQHIYPSDLVRLAAQEVAGAVLMGGSVTAHIAILAQSLSLPVLITSDRRALDIVEGTPVLLDASGGQLYLNPSQAVLEIHRRRLVTESLAPSPQSPQEDTTADHVRVQIMVNVNLYRDATEAARVGAGGIGLYRSEFPFIIRNDFLGEEEQYRIYRRIVEASMGRPVLLRTADIGGDKLLRGRQEVEQNPFLGVRGIRFSLANREFFREQLRAMLRAGDGADLGIMLPMVSSVEEVEEARVELERCAEELSAEGVAHNRSPRLGAMVELPSAAMAVEDLTAATDFLSVGTNDLVMYLLAVDRTNERLGELYRSHHPTVLRVISQIARGAGDKLSELSICGDSASDPLMIPFYLGIGVRKLSVAPTRIESTRKTLSQLTVDRCRTVANEMLAIRRLGDMDSYLDRLKVELADAEPLDVAR